MEVKLETAVDMDNIGPVIFEDKIIAAMRDMKAVDLLKCLQSAFAGRVNAPMQQKICAVLDCIDEKLAGPNSLGILSESILDYIINNPERGARGFRAINNMEPRFLRMDEVNHKLQIIGYPHIRTILQSSLKLEVKSETLDIKGLSSPTDVRAELQVAVRVSREKRGFNEGDSHLGTGKKGIEGFGGRSMAKEMDAGDEKPLAENSSRTFVTSSPVSQVLNIYPNRLASAKTALSSHWNYFRGVLGFSVPATKSNVAFNGNPCTSARFHERVAKLSINQLARDNLGMIQPSSTSLWSSPILLVRKPYGDNRLRFNDRKPNAVTKRDMYYDDILNNLHDAFWQIPLEPDSVEKCGFTVSGSGGHYEFTRFPFGLHNSLETQQRLLGQLFPKCFRPN
ncbi:hypothetical protein ILUMI_02161 [Ignelater luminosus]|uniref:Uncharacterized protein n=1 Tax=Ignelater luminosus TaxID=2038154 RepID=A0A8K0DDY9_IGNLU|nr:hypothetical protein ILUMI_02161 [Ignelater luminosus]